MGVGELGEAPQDQGDGLPETPSPWVRWATTTNLSNLVWAARTQPGLGFASSIADG